MMKKTWFSAISVLLSATCFAQEYVPNYIEAAPENNNTLYVQDYDIVIGKFSRETMQGNPPIAVFVYGSYREPRSKLFFKKFMPVLQDYIDRGKAIAVFRPHKDDPAGTLAYSAAQCVPKEQQYAFLYDITVNKTDWQDKKDPLPTLRSYMKEYGVSAQAQQKCLRDPRRLAAVRALADKQMMRPNKYPYTLFHYYINNRFSPSITEEEPFFTTFKRQLENRTGLFKKDWAAFEQLQEIKPTDYVLGNPNADVKVIYYNTPEFGSMAYFLNKVLPQMGSYFDAGKLAVVYRPYAWFETGQETTALMSCVDDDKFFKFAAYAAQNIKAHIRKDGPWIYNPQVKELLLSASSAYFDQDKDGVKACMENPKTKQKLADIRDEADRVLNYYYSPTMIVNGTEYRHPYKLESFKYLVDQALAQKEAQKKATEQQGE